MKIQFVMCGSPNAAFYSQAAMYRLMLDRLGGDYGMARQVLCLGAEEVEPVPETWRKPLERVDVVWADPVDYRMNGELAQSLLTYQVIQGDADLAVICDADTLLLRPFPADFLEAMRREPALCGCIAHFGPTLSDDRKGAVPPASDDELWLRLSERLLPAPIRRPYRYTLQRKGDPPPGSCPFYINLGFFVGTPSLFARYFQQHERVIPIVRQVMDNKFYEQLAVPFAVERAGLPRRALPMRFNFPNDPLAEETYPDEAANVVNVHYLRRTHFDRHRIFASREDFDRFMSLSLRGIDACFQQAVREATGGVYCF